jgi:hypothetical protein
MAAFDLSQSIVRKSIAVPEKDRIGPEIVAGFDEVPVGWFDAERLDAQGRCQPRNITVTESADIPVVADHAVVKLEIRKKLPVAITAKHHVAGVNYSHEALVLAVDSFVRCLEILHFASFKASMGWRKRICFLP